MFGISVCFFTRSTMHFNFRGPNPVKRARRFRSQPHPSILSLSLSVSTKYILLITITLDTRCSNSSVHFLNFDMEGAMMYCKGAMMYRIHSAFSSRGLLRRKIGV